LDDMMHKELEAAAFRRLVQHLRKRSDVQNIELSLSKEEAREIIYGMPYETWKSMFQTEIPAKPHKQSGSAG
jgi:hypothetical protein